MKTETEQNVSVETAAAPFAPVPFIGLIQFVENEKYNGVVKSAEVTVDYKGRNVTVIKIDSEAGLRTKVYMTHTAGTCGYVLDQLGKAFGLEDFEKIEELAGQPCTFSTHTNDYTNKVEIEYINRYNPHAGEKVDLSAMTAMAKAAKAAKEAETVAIEDVQF